MKTILNEQCPTHWKATCSTASQGGSESYFWVGHVIATKTWDLLEEHEEAEARYEGLLNAIKEGDLAGISPRVPCDVETRSRTPEEHFHPRGDRSLLHWKDGRIRLVMV